MVQDAVRVAEKALFTLRASGCQMHPVQVTTVIIMISPLALHNVRCSLQTGSLHVIAVEELQFTADVATG
jgi:hypothetical protein